MSQTVNREVPFLFPAGAVNVGALCLLEDGTPYALVDGEAYAVEYVRSIAFPDEGNWRIRTDGNGKVLKRQRLPPGKEDATRKMREEHAHILFPDGMRDGQLWVLHPDTPDETPYALVNGAAFALEPYKMGSQFCGLTVWYVRKDKNGNPVLQGLPPVSVDSTLRRFLLVRHHDPTEVSGTGIVAEGVEYAESRMCALFWRNSASGGIYLNADVIREKHCHHGFTQFVWVDEA